MQTDTIESVRADLASFWKPKQHLGPLQWCEGNVVLDGRYTPRPGRFSCDFTPYLRGPHEWFGDPKVRQITFCKSAQVGGTTLLGNLIMYSIAEAPGPILYVTSTSENAKSWSERELIPRLKSCPLIRDLMPENEDDFRKMEMHFKSCTLRLVGSNSEGNLASRPIKILFADEIEKWPNENQKEAPALELALARTNFFRSTRKVILTSTPTIEAGPIWQNFLKGSQHRFHVPCPECGHLQPLRFEQMIWSRDLRGENGEWDLDAVADSAMYQCEDCGGLWEQGRQRELVGLGEWKATNPNAPRDHISAHISAMYSPQMTWGEIAKIFLQKKETPGGLHDFQNSFLGEPWQERAATIKDEAILDLRDKSYRLRQCPIDDPALVTLCADVGERETHWCVEARNEEGESWVIDYGRVLAPEDLISETFQNSLTYPTPSGVMVKPTAGLIDSGYNTERVYEVCKQALGYLYPYKGSDASFGLYTTSQVKGYSFPLYIGVDYTLKVSLYLERIQKRLPPLLHLPSDVGRDFINGLSGQRLLESKTNKQVSRYWKPVREDHFGDCVKMSMLGWWIARDPIIAQRRAAREQ